MVILFLSSEYHMIWNNKIPEVLIVNSQSLNVPQQLLYMKLLDYLVVILNTKVFGLNFERWQIQPSFHQKQLKTMVLSIWQD